MRVHLGKKRGTAEKALVLTVESSFHDTSDISHVASTLE